MAKLSKTQMKLHAEAVQLIECGRPLKDDEKEFILDNWQESANHMNAAAGAFFTPRGLARDFALEINHGDVIDLCAGIGYLGYYVEHKVSSLTCVEINPEYARIGKRILPDAEWITASAFAAQLNRRWDWAISNPPFGRIPAMEFSGKYTGSEFEFKIIELASRIANFGAFIIPQGSAPFQYSGRRGYQENCPDKVARFMNQTRIKLEMNCGIDTTIHINEWRGVSPMCEIVLAEFERPSVASQMSFALEAA